jgi:orotidine-5'-phosphate decarboxylase
VLGLVEPGSTSDVLLSAAVTGRGVYQQTQDVNDFDEFLREVGRDIRLQVVE